MYEYEYPHPAVTADVVVFTIRQTAPEVLLVKRSAEPYKGTWALPGGFVEISESLEAAAARELAEETGITGACLEQLHAFGRPDRDPRERVISVAYFALIPWDGVRISASSDAADVGWFGLDELPPLAFDHREILDMALERLRARLE